MPIRQVGGETFCKANYFEPKSEGIYVPISNIAFVNFEYAHLITNAFHEFFGHGILL